MQHYLVLTAAHITYSPQWYLIQRATSPMALAASLKHFF